MGLRDMYSAGDIIEYEGGGRDYLVSIEGEEGLWVNACNPSWIERGLRSFCDECRPFFSDRLYEGAEVVGTEIDLRALQQLIQRHDLLLRAE